MPTFINKIFKTPLLQNKFVLYASLFAVLFALVRNISNGNMNAVILMALVGLLTSYFSKNMIIILLTAFFTVFILEMLGSKGVMEGMETKKIIKRKIKIRKIKIRKREIMTRKIRKRIIRMRKTIKKTTILRNLTQHYTHKMSRSKR